MSDNDKIIWHECKTGTIVGDFTIERSHNGVLLCPLCGEECTYFEAELGDDAWGQPETASWMECDQCAIETDTVS